MTSRPSPRRGSPELRALLQPLDRSASSHADRGPSRSESARLGNELASLLTAILGQAELARTDPSAPGRARALLELERAGERARELCRRLQRVAALHPVHSAPLPTPDPGATVLVVDDEPSVRAAARRILEAVGHRVLEAEDGEQALRVQARHAELGLVVLDLTMPKRGGPETLAALREVAPELPVIITSGYDAEEVSCLVPTLGVGRFLRKPFSPEALRRAVRLALR